MLAALPLLARATAFNDYRTLLLSRESGMQGAPGRGSSFAPSISLDGSITAFVSKASNLGPRRASEEVFERNVNNNRTTLVSRANGPNGAPANGDATSPAISGSGEIVAFAAGATNLGGGRHVQGIYVRNLNTNETLLISRASGKNGAAANSDCFSPAISVDGNKVVFATTATNLGGGARPVMNIYMRDLSSDRTTLISRASGGAGANADSAAPAISSLGSVVAFESKASNLSPDASGKFDQIFEHSVQSNKTFLISRASGSGPAGNADSLNPSVDANGAKVAFQSAATNLSDMAQPVENIFMRDVGANQTLLGSRGLGVRGPAANGDSTNPSFPRDGRFVCFESVATNLGNSYDGFGVDTAVKNVYTHDFQNHGTFLISRKTGRYASGANGDSANVSCSPGASLAAFQSAATNLGGRAGVTSVYRRTIFGGR